MSTPPVAEMTLDDCIREFEAVHNVIYDKSGCSEPDFCSRALTVFLEREGDASTPMAERKFAFEDLRRSLKIEDNISAALELVGTSSCFRTLAAGDEYAKSTAIAIMCSIMNMQLMKDCEDGLIARVLKDNLTMEFGGDLSPHSDNHVCLLMMLMNVYGLTEDPWIGSLSTRFNAILTVDLESNASKNWLMESRSQCRTAGDLFVLEDLLARYRNLSDVIDEHRRFIPEDAFHEFKNELAKEVAKKWENAMNLLAKHDKLSFDSFCTGDIDYGIGDIITAFKKLCPTKAGVPSMGDNLWGIILARMVNAMIAENANEKLMNWKNIAVKKAPVECMPILWKLISNDVVKRMDLERQPTDRELLSLVQHFDIPGCSGTY